MGKVTALPPRSRKSINRWLLVQLLLLQATSGLWLPVPSFQAKQYRSSTSDRLKSLCIAHANSNENDGSEKKGYKFGDMSKFLATQAKEKVNGLTGKTTYEFGDLSRWLDGRAKERVLAIKGGENGGYKYEVGDFTRWADALAKEKAAQFSGKVTANEYELGDITKTIIPKIRSGEYNLEDIYLSLRVLAMAGFALLPIARFVPIQALIPLVNVGLAKDVGGRLTELLLTGLDARMKEALTGNANYQLGDIAKDRLRQELSLFTGKEIYAVGDLTRTIVERASARPKNQSGDLPDESSELGVAVASEEKTPLKISEELLRDLAQWDAAFLEQQGNPNPKQ